MLLEVNSLWSHNAEMRLSNIPDTRSDCHGSSRPPPSRDVSVSILSREFKDIVCIYHAFLDCNHVLNAMESRSDHLPDLVCEDMSFGPLRSTFGNRSKINAREKYSELDFHR